MPLRPHRLRRPGLYGTLLAVLAGLLLLGAQPAAAHAALTGTDPQDGSVVATAPRQVTLSFSEGVQLSADSVRVLDPKGRAVTEGTPHHVRGKNSTAAVSLRKRLPQGTFTVAWKAVSEDSHPVSGAFTFSIGKPSKTVVATPGSGTGGSAGTLYDTGRYLAYAGFIAMVGAAVFAGVCGGRSPALRRLAAGGWALLFAATTALLLLRGPYTGEGFDLGKVLSSKPGEALLSRLLLLGAAAVFLAVLFGSYERVRAASGGLGGPDSPDGPGALGASDGSGTLDGSGSDGPGSDGSGSGSDTSDTSDPDTDRRTDLAYGLGIGGAVIAAGLAATWAMAEHASVGIQPLVAMPVTALHLLAVAVWLGGLASLAVTMRGGPPVARATVQRFSRLALWCVTVIVATGVYQAWRGIGTWDALTSTTYGQLLLVKLGLVAVLVGTAWMSRRWTARLAEADSHAGAGSEETRGEESPEPAAVAAHTAKAEDGASAHTSGPHGTKLPAQQKPDPERAAQLARQQAAVDATRERRARDADVNRSGLRRSVLAETAIAVVLLSVTTALTGTQPGRAEAEQRAAKAPQAQRQAGPASVKIPYDTGGRNGKGTAEVTVDPARAGANTLQLFLTNPNGELVDAPEAKVSFTLAARKIGPLRAKLTKADTGHWTARGLRLPMAGTWTVEVTVRTSAIDQVTEAKRIKIG